MSTPTSDTGEPLAWWLTMPQESHRARCTRTLGRRRTVAAILALAFTIATLLAGVLIGAQGAPQTHQGHQTHQTPRESPVPAISQLPTL